MSQRGFKSGEAVVFRKLKYSSAPGPRAVNVDPAPLGDKYTYQVDKFWTVVEQRPDGSVLVQTRRGKQHLVSADDPNLRHATWWERLLHFGRFPRVKAEADSP